MKLVLQELSELKSETQKIITHLKGIEDTIAEIKTEQTAMKNDIAEIRAEQAVMKNDITIDVTPPETIQEGEYTIPCTAVSASETLTTELTVTIIGTYDLSVSTPSGNLSLDAYANAEKSFTLTVMNTGNVDLTNINLSSSLPTDWEADFSESTIDTLEAGATKEVTVNLTPSSDAITGDYVATITASTDEASADASFRVSIKTHTSWGIAAVVIILALLACLGVVFKKYGRR